jgi:hypothetical protein
VGAALRPEGGVDHGTPKRKRIVTQVAAYIPSSESVVTASRFITRNNLQRRNKGNCNTITYGVQIR